MARRQHRTGCLGDARVMAAMVERLVHHASPQPPGRLQLPTDRRTWGRSACTAARTPPPSPRPRPAPPAPLTSLLPSSSEETTRQKSGCSTKPWQATTIVTGHSAAGAAPGAPSDWLGALGPHAHPRRHARCPVHSGGRLHDTTDSTNASSP